MEIWIVVLLSILLTVLLFFFWQSARQWREIRAGKEKDPSFLLLQQQIDSLRDQVGRSLDGNVQIVHQQLSSLSSQITGHLNSVASQLTEQVGTGMGLIQKASQHFSDRVQEVQARMAQMDEASKRILEVGRSIATLQEILRAPKIRGGLGEFLLGDLLGQIMPAEYFALQYSFQSGERVDAVIRLSQGLVPVDAKFPLENFQKSLMAQEDGARKNFLKLFAVDVKRHVESIANKYILPHEGTCDFALMYIPAENVYYEAFIKDEAAGEGKSLREFAFEKHVRPGFPEQFLCIPAYHSFGAQGFESRGERPGNPPASVRTARAVGANSRMNSGSWENTWNKPREVLMRASGSSKGLATNWRRWRRPRFFRPPKKSRNNFGSRV